MSKIYDKKLKESIKTSISTSIKEIVAKSKMVKIYEGKRAKRK